MDILQSAMRTTSVLRTRSVVSFLLLSSQLQVVCNEKFPGRIIVDCGWTKMYCSWKEAGTARYVTNATIWLLSLEHKLDAETFSTAASEEKESKMEEKDIKTEKAEEKTESKVA